MIGHKLQITTLLVTYFLLWWAGVGFDHVKPVLDVLWSVHVPAIVGLYCCYQSDDDMNGRVDGVEYHTVGRSLCMEGGSE